VTEYIVDILWDHDVAVWVATSNDIPGLVMESGSLDALIERIRLAIPELLELNGISISHIPLCFRSERHEKITQ
jgi:hypothetical protein